MVSKTKKDWACKSCSMVSDREQCTCGGQMAREWSGYVIILDHNRSEIAKKMGVNVEGRFALKVR